MSEHFQNSWGNKSIVLSALNASEVIVHTPHPFERSLNLFDRQRVALTQRSHGAGQVASIACH